MHVLAAIGFLAPYVASAIVLAMLFGLAMQGRFAEAGEEGKNIRPVHRFARASTFFGMFSIFGVVIAYFLSIGIKEDDNNVINPLVEGFSTPLVALLTAGVSYFARQEAPQNNVTVVAAGVTCFLLESVICYRGLYLDFLAHL